MVLPTQDKKKSSEKYLIISKTIMSKTDINLVQLLTTLKKQWKY